MSGVNVLPMLRTHWWVNPGLLSPFGSVMPEVSAVRVLPTARTPLTAGSPVGLALGGLTTGPVALLVRVSSYPSSSVKLTRTLMVWSRSRRTSV